jgi:LCP family protein required for cell wall assembly
MIGTVVYLNIAGRNELTNSDNLSIAVPDGVESSDNGMYVVYNGVQYKYNENIASILCMGIDRETLGNVDDHIGTGGSADALFLITIDTETGDTNLVNISRETMTDIGIYSTDGNYIETENAQICLAYAYGDGAETSCRNELVAVKQLFYNIPINSYLSMDLQGISVINDAIGGITVVSPETIGTFVAGETYNLRGSQAQSFVRDRTHATVEGNNLRMERQKVYLESFASSLISKTKSDITTPINIFNAAQPYICTNLDASKVTHLAITAIRGGYNEFEIKTVPGKVKQGDEYAEFYVNEDDFYELFLELFYNPVDDFR